MTPIHDLESQIRDFINEPRRQTSLIREKAVWGMLCSSLDVIGDTELAMEAYLKGGDNESKDGRKPDFLIASGNLYITLYGILQIIFVQQDAVKHLAEALGFDYARDPRLKTIREVRNDAIGHPTKRGKAEAFNFISRITLSRGGCQLLTMRADGTTEFRDIDVPSMIAEQRLAVATALAGILEKLREDEMAHRKKFAGSKLADAFPSTLGYYHEKISDTIDGGMPGAFGASILESVAGYVAKFKEGLAERGSLDAYDAVTYEFDLLEYPIAELHKYFTNPQESKLNAKDALIFHHFIRSRIKTLIDMAKEIDQEYEQEV
jgi:hypothetical protein